MTKPKGKPYNLEQRTLEFSKSTINLCKKLIKGQLNYRLVDQLIRSATSVGANYREANEALSKKDFAHRMKITRKECKEASYWFEIIKEANAEHADEINNLLKESQELRNIFTAIIEKTK